MGAQKLKKYLFAITLVLSFIGSSLSPLWMVQAQGWQGETRSHRRFEKFRTPPFYPRKTYPRSAARRTTRPSSRKTNSGRRITRSNTMKEQVSVLETKHTF
jgi:hypothetical protein